MADAHSTEVWRPVVDWVGLYEVSNLGRVRNVTTSAILNQPIGTEGYPCVRLRDRLHRRVKMPRAHRLVALAFLGPQPIGMEVNHIDGNKLNPHVTNLEWVTSRQNKQHAWRLGLRNRSHLPLNYGEKNGASRLTETSIRLIHMQHQQGVSLRRLAREFKVDRNTIRKVTRGITWKHIAMPAAPAGEKP